MDRNWGRFLSHRLVLSCLFLVTGACGSPGGLGQDAAPLDASRDALGPTDVPTRDGAADGTSPDGGPGVDGASGDRVAWDGAADAEPPDAARPDAAPRDAVSPDAAPPDGTIPDAYAVDARIWDSGALLDAGLLDAAFLDAAIDAGCGPPDTPPSPVSDATELLPSPLDTSSQYSPWVMHEPGWQSYLMYYCKNTPINGIWRDRIWRAESWGDGLSNFSPGQVVIEGEMGHDDDLSCSPGVVIDGTGTWHMYYVGADRNASMTLYLFHATATAPGLSWTKLGKVSGAFPQPVPGYLETPSPILMGNRIVLYFVGQGGRLFRAESTDGQNFSAPVELPSPSWVAHGRVTFDGSRYHYVYAANPGGCCDPPTAIFYSVSSTGDCFDDGVLLFQALGTGWDGSRVWSPDPVVQGSLLRVYYAANRDDAGCVPACDQAHSCQSGSCVWWGADTSIGVRLFSLP